MQTPELQKVELQTDIRHQVTFPSLLQNKSDVRDQLTEILRDRGLEEMDLFFLELANEEALTNAVRHGNWENRDNDGDGTIVPKEMRDRPVYVTMEGGFVPQDFTLERRRRVGDEIEQVRKEACNYIFRVCIRDEGNGFDVTKVPDCRAPENLQEEHGRGIALMQYAYDHVDYPAEHGGRQVEMAYAMRRERPKPAKTLQFDLTNNPELVGDETL